MSFANLTGSMTNHILARATKGQPDPVRGMGVTILSYTDRSAGTIIDVFYGRSAKFVMVQEDMASRTDTNGMSECQSYAFSPNPNGAFYTFRQAKSGAWDEVKRNKTTGRWRKFEGHGLRVGERGAYHDYSF